ncbi:MAG: oxidative damage protection protein [Myxococcales bacterium]|nr:oxidative damage protection protein [Myxococcales bacterium]
MPRLVQCIKLKREAEGLEKPPLKGPMGQKIFENISKEAWQQWLEHSKMLINEYRLDLVSETGQKIWFTELEKYFWGDGSKLPDEFKPVEPDEKGQ